MVPRRYPSDYENSDPKFSFPVKPCIHMQLYSVYTIILILACNCGLWPHCLLGPPLVGCGYKIVLRKGISYGRTYSSGVHVFQDDMLLRAYVLREVMLLVECMSSGWHILQYVVFYLKKCLTGVYVLQEDISGRLICLTGEHHLYEDKFYCRVCLISSHVLHEGMSYVL